ncbi:uncharacterized protein LOC111705788 isoform X2 [Eurytemora carolleeae]|uniref:uncharacterized protein LOC111705788 isoform X2 n=1 Tax=Eurytemora carolleeae TaxID=1294199 RepID=UPI000C759AC2|nr:uncharacterized protein LOC111705788 isoform X2 [Eurytemora carolleeae]|eukprot:XP_023334230.1 uncharacterized protein LOC111705788 isoform X2 [Eurytemora affinis]
MISVLFLLLFWNDQFSGVYSQYTDKRLVFNHTCGLKATTPTCLKTIDPSVYFYERNEGTCFCYGRYCYYFSFRTDLKLNWQDSKRMCECRGESLLNVIEDGEINAISFFTQGLLTGLHVQDMYRKPVVLECYKYLACIKSKAAVVDTGPTQVCKMNPEQLKLCDQMLSWVDQRATEDLCGSLAAWSNNKNWLNCQEKIHFVCVSEGNAFFSSLPVILLCFLVLFILLFFYPSIFLI